ncbi:MAG: NAD-dependent epimerase/dehydratase family protein [Acidobacteria bacterium]|nr:NAD-dependent epimerase/dehydratase family protein [Acidobacteriota bacterium]
MKALVTGAAGFIGSTLSERLVDQGAEVVGIDSFTDYYPRPVKEGNLARLRAEARFRFVEASIQHADLDPLFDGVTHVFHLAAQAGVRKSWGRDFHIYTVNNIDATQMLLEACVRHPVERFVYASSSSVYGDHVPLPMREESLLQPVSPYGVSKLAGEQLCHLYFVNFGVPATSLRYFTVYGPRQRPDMGFHLFLKAAIRGTPIHVFGDGEQTRDFTFVADAVTATAVAATLGVPGRVYNIGGGSRVSLNHVLDLIVKTTGRRIEITRGPAQKGDMRDTYANTSAARTDLRFAPSVSLPDGLAAEYQWIQTVYA